MCKAKGSDVFNGLWINTGFAAIFLFLSLMTTAQDAQQIARDLANPIAELISVPVQTNVDANIGIADEGRRTLVNIEPVLPFSIGSDWALISRTILPVIWQDNIFPHAGSQSGTGDIVQSLFFSPKRSTSGGWNYGVGPVFLMRTASDDLLGTGKWGLGPTAVILKQEGGWSFGSLFNHIWSVAGDDDRKAVNATFAQPFLVYSTKTATTFAINTETTYDWASRQWSVPINVTVSQVVKIKALVFSVGAGLRYWVESPEMGPKELGGRLLFTMLLPK